MARAPNPKAKEAEELFRKGLKLIEIANRLEVSEGTVRSWKSRYKWDDENNATLQKEKRNVAKGRSPSKNNQVNHDTVEVVQDDELNEKQKLFCLYYIQENFNKTKAYMKAYGCNYEAARKNVSKIMANYGVKQEIDRLTEEALADVGVNTKLLAQRIFDQYINIAFSDIKDYLSFGKKTIEYVDKKGLAREAEISYVDLNESSEVDGTIVTEVKQGKDGVSIKLADKMKAMEWLSEHADLATPEQKLRMDKLKADIEKSSGSNNQENNVAEILRGVFYGNARADN